MPGMKRKATASFATPYETPRKLVKRTTSHTIARATSGSGDGGSATPPPLRKAPTITVEDKETTESKGMAKKASSKKLSVASKPSLTKKTSSVVTESGTVTTVVPLKSGSSVGETSLTSKESLKKAASITKSLSKAASVNSEPSEEPAAASSAPLPPGGLLEVAVSFDTTGSMYGVLAEVRAKVKDLAQRLQADIPGIRIAVIAHGDYCDVDKYIVKWIDFGASLPELCDFVEKVEETYGGDGPECYELVLKKAREELSWTPGSQRVLIMIGDDEPHPVGYTYKGQKHYIDWKKECNALKEMGAKVYGVQSGSDSGATKFFSGMARLTDGRHVNLSNFSSIFDFLMMICYREGNPDMLPVYASEIRARHVGGMAKDTEFLAAAFCSTSTAKAPKPKAVKAVKVVKAVKPKAPKTKPKAKTVDKKATKPTKVRKAGKKTKKPVKKTKKTSAKGKVKKGIPKTSVKKIKGKTMKRKPKKKVVKKKKLLREKLNDAKFITGPVGKLKWSQWILAVTDTRPKGYSKTEYPQSRKYGFWRDTFVRQGLFAKEELSVPSILEVGAKFPEEAKRKIYVLYFKDIYGFRLRSSKKTLNILSFIKTSDIRENIGRLVKDKLKIYIRRATGSKADVKAAAKYLHGNFDYAWGWRRSHSRTVEKNGVLLSR